MLTDKKDSCIRAPHSNPTRRLDPVKTAHRDVHQNPIRLFLREAADCLLAARTLGNCASRFKEAFHQPTPSRVVIHHQKLEPAMRSFVGIGQFVTDISNEWKTPASVQSAQSD